MTSCLLALPEPWLPTEVILSVTEGCSGWVAAATRNTWHMPRSRGSSALVLSATGETLPGSAGAGAGARGCFFVTPGFASSTAGW